MRLLSLIVVASFIGLRLFEAQPPSLNAAVGLALLLCISFLFPLACIWFGDEMGDYVGALPGPAINRRTPGGLVKAGGWVLLLIPIGVWWFVIKA